MNGTATTREVPAPPSDPLGHRIRWGADAWISLGAFLLVVGIAEAHGGYFPTAWGWGVLALGWIAGVALIVRPNLALDRLALGFLASLAALIAWIALSTTWTSDIDASVQELQRGLLYVVGAFAALLVVRSHNVGSLLGGLLAGTFWISGQALGGRLFPGSGPASESLDLGRLTEPIGYFNTLGLFAVMGALLALGFAVHGRHVAGRAAAAAALPILVTTAYFTFSRGAVLALGVGLIAMIALDPRRLKVLTTGLAVAVPAAAAVWLASRAPGLTTTTAPRSEVADDGRRLAIELLVLTVGGAVVATVMARVERQVRIPSGASRAYGAALALAATALVVGVVVAQGGPGSLVRDAYDGINANPSPDIGASNLGRRLLSISSTGRVDHWRVALREHEEHPWRGGGAGTYEQYWQRDRAVSFQVRDAHSLYLETLGELGWLGLGLLVVMLAVPLAGALRARHHPLVAGAFGAYVAYLARAGIDWDWEMPAVTLLALACGAVLVAAADDQIAERRAIPALWRGVALAATVAITVFSLIGLIGNRALADATRKVDLADFRGGEADARKAARWAPWSAEALQQLGRAQVGRGLEPEGLANLRKAASKRPADWQVWYELGIASSGPQRARAYLRAARLNPREPDIEILRDQGRRLPKPPPPE